MLSPWVAHHVIGDGTVDVPTMKIKGTEHDPSPKHDLYVNLRDTRLVHIRPCETWTHTFRTNLFSSSAPH